MSERKAVFTVIERGEGKKSFWLRIGAAFPNKDGSLSVVLDALPINGRLQIREEQPREREEAPPQRRQQRSAPRDNDFGGYSGGDSDIPF